MDKNIQNKKLNTTFLKDRGLAQGGFYNALSYTNGRPHPAIVDALQHKDSFNFYSQQLEKLDPQVVKPRYFITYNKDIPIVYGGGFVDKISYFRVNWDGIVAEARAVVADNSTYFPRVNASMDKLYLDVYTFEAGYDLKFLELEKMKQYELQQSIEAIYREVVVASWDIFCQNLAYTGFNGVGGLFTNPDIVPHQISVSDSFETLTDAQVVGIFNTIFQTYLANSPADFQMLPDTILVPTFVGADLSRRVNTLYTNTLRTFLATHNLAVEESFGELKQINIISRRGLDRLGATFNGRIVAYRKDENFVKMHIPYPLNHFITLPNMERMCYTTSFVGQASLPQLSFNEAGKFGAVSYWDITTTAKAGSQS